MTRIVVFVLVIIRAIILQQWSAMSCDSETVEDTVKAEVTDDSCTVEYIEIVPLDREYDVHHTAELIQPIFEIGPEYLQKLKQETADENENGYPNYQVKQEPGDECETEGSLFTVQVSSVFIYSFICGMDHYKCVAPNLDIILQSPEWTIRSQVNCFIQGEVQ